ncbi:MAG: c-type cytochrome domain-containing protein [Planctomycetota bacterium]
MSPRLPSLALCLALFCSCPAGIYGQETTPPAEKPVSYYRSVRPILQRYCSGCHFAGKREGELSVTSVAELAKGGAAGTAFTAGQPDQSVIIRYISGEDPEMPLNGDPLKPEQVETLRRWIAQGATDDTPASLEKPVSPQNPPVYSTPPVVTAIDYSPDGRRLAVSGYHEVQIHTLDGSAPVQRLIGRSQRIESLAFSPDGHLLAVAGGTPALFGELQLWNIAESRLLHAVTLGTDSLFGVSFNTDGSLVAFGGADNRLRVVNVASGEVKMRMDAHADWVLGTTFSLKNDHVISVSRDRSMKLTIVENGQFVDNITSITPGALKGGLADVQRMPTTEEVLAGGADGEPRLYRIFRERARQIGDDFNLIRSYPRLEGRVTDIDVSPSGARFIAGASTAVSGSARLYTTADPAKTIDLQGLTSPVFAVSIRGDEKQAAVAGFDGTVRLYNADTGALETSFPAAAISAPPAATAAVTR